MHSAKTARDLHRHVGPRRAGTGARQAYRASNLTPRRAKLLVWRRYPPECYSAGYHEVVSYRHADPVAAVRELTSGAGASVVFDSVGGPQSARSFRMPGNEGTVILCGRSAGPLRRGAGPDLGIRGPDHVRRNLALRDFYLSTHGLDHLAEVPRRIEVLAEAMRAGLLHVPTAPYAFGDVRAAHEALESGATSGELVLQT